MALVIDGVLLRRKLRQKGGGDNGFQAGLADFGIAIFRRHDLALFGDANAMGRSLRRQGPDGIEARPAAATHRAAHTAGRPSGEVFVQTDNTSGNAIAVYHRNADGTLTAAGQYGTGGLGGVLSGSAEPSSRTFAAETTRSVRTRTNAA